ncbi:MAG: FprA family A-type flavoprotein [Clostridia bacterium]|nr:FprA family A-type flavoprotein [Clostridia bacterium]
MHITDDIRYIGVNDHELDLFEGQYVVPNGMAYNSYLLLDEKIAVMDSVDRGFTSEWLSNIRAEIGERPVDYLIVQHMEPDHSGSLAAFMAAYPQAVVVASAKAFSMMKAFFSEDYEDRRLIVKEGDTLSLGRHTLSFVAAPMVHWPEVIMTYDQADKILFSADAFGKFGALDVEEEWACEARRYYIGIVGKYGAQVQALLKKAAKLDIRTICPLHGPVLRENLGYYLNLYDIWSSYRAESEGVVIACASIYGHTMQAAALLKDELEARGEKVSLIDLARCDMAEAVEDAFRYDRLVLASSTYNGGVFPFMRTFIDHLTERNYQNRTVGLMENGSWAPTAAKVMRTMLEKSKDITFTETTVKIVSALSDDSRTQVMALADELMNS